MDLEELLQRITNMERILELGTHPAPESGSEMTREQLIADNRFLRETLRDLQRQLEEANQTNKQNGEQIVKLYQLLDLDKEEKQKLLAIIESLQCQLAENKKMRFGSKSVKGIDKKPENKGKHDDKDDFDGTPGSLSTQGEEPEPSAEIKQSKGHNRKGSTYKTFEADAKIIHKSDRSQLPEGSEIIKVFTQKVFDHISLIVEHEFECISYLQSFWKQLVAWRNDGNYSIDNNVSERAIRPITLQRKTSLQFGSKRGVEISAIYHTIIETCKLSGLNPRAYLKRFFQEISIGRTDFDNLLPATIGRV